MKKYTLFGNCQAAAMRWLLIHFKEFNDLYEYIEIKPSYEMNEEEAKDFYNNIIPKLDLLFMHPHSFNRSEWHEHTLLSKRALECGVKLIKFPQVLFSVYNPFECLPNFTFSANFTNDIIHFDTLILKAIINNWNAKELLLHIEENKEYYEKLIIAGEKYYLNAMKKLEIERGCDFKISDFFEENYKKTRLVHNVNHPTAIGMNFICTQLLKTINQEWESHFDIDCFDNHDSYIFPLVKETLGLEFASNIEHLYEKLGNYYAVFHSLGQSEKDEFISIHDKHYTWLEHLSTL